MKTFKQLREATAKKEVNPEAAALKPRAEGEQDFYDMHKRETEDYPVKGTSDKVNAQQAAKTLHQPGNGDRTAPKQGTSSLPDKSGFKGSKTPLTRADKTQGDFKPVLTSPTSVGGKWSGYAAEHIFVNKPIISESSDDSVVFELLNGDVVEINEDVYSAIVDMYEQLNTGNREIFRSAINESADSFERILDFIADTVDGE
jgi:hypothetical protein